MMRGGTVPGITNSGRNGQGQDEFFIALRTHIVDMKKGVVVIIEETLLLFLHFWLVIGGRGNLFLRRRERGAATTPGPPGGNEFGPTPAPTFSAFAGFLSWLREFVQLFFARGGNATFHLPNEKIRILVVIVTNIRSIFFLDKVEDEFAFFVRKFFCLPGFNVGDSTTSCTTTARAADNTGAFRPIRIAVLGGRWRLIGATYPRSLKPGATTPHWGKTNIDLSPFELSFLEPLTSPLVTVIAQGAQWANE